MKNLLLLLFIYNLSLPCFSEKLFHLAPKTQLPTIINLIVSNITISDSNMDKFTYRKTFVTTEMDKNVNDTSTLDDGRKFTYNVKKLNFILEDNNEKEREIITLPDNITKKLIEYLQIGHAEEPFDCACFVHFLNDVPYYFDNSSYKNWRITWQRSENTLIPGDSIIIGNATRTSYEWRHMAIYIGKGLYLSKFSTNSPLKIMSLSNMKKAFKSDYLFKMTKVQDMPYIDLNSFILQLYSKFSPKELFEKLDKLKKKLLQST